MSIVPTSIGEGGGGEDGDGKGGEGEGGEGGGGGGEGDGGGGECLGNVEARSINHCSGTAQKRTR